ncbi:MAG: hypothetical protein CFH21_00951 [Alphaproteobacteria bacterium MarineAlpha5_Bin11]|nr:urease accessory protein UreJ [Pelagibacteraceae bacterium]PPR42954.1 MAG: hypothetical protein CFH21_00951 [Alphaproteobacteria bacterium MarineAlpha5_Bin11]PPR51554.1 MAG: hypothetical protein CFH20_00481 [Alphaproteobacteria bacterium MarineAlpha5_Bin10]|tara:strand:+ start:1149 stop:1757 length:609 start_codon:yes stop_codon:yes gene_type:complete
MFRFIIFFLFLSFFSSLAEAHTFTGMVGFYDGISHPVLGIDHFLAMVSVGVISAQIGGRAIWKIPTTFVCIMLIGGIVGISFELSHQYNSKDYITMSVEVAIILSVILLGIAISMEQKIPNKVTIIFIGIFGLFHGIAHGLEMPWAANPILFALGFTSGTAILHLFGVAIGYFATQNFFSTLLLRIAGFFCAIYGIYLLFAI